MRLMFHLTVFWCGDKFFDIHHLLLCPLPHKNAFLPNSHTRQYFYLWLVKWWHTICHTDILLTWVNYICIFECKNEANHLQFTKGRKMLIQDKQIFWSIFHKLSWIPPINFNHKYCKLHKTYCGCLLLLLSTWVVTNTCNLCSSINLFIKRISKSLNFN